MVNRLQGRGRQGTSIIRPISRLGNSNEAGEGGRGPILSSVPLPRSDLGWRAEGGPGTTLEDQ